MSVIHVSGGFLIAFLAAFGCAGGPGAQPSVAFTAEAGRTDTDPAGARRVGLPPPQPPADAWRRTVRGWEQRDERGWLEPVRAPLPPAAAIHPLVVASWLVLVSLGSLLSLPPRPR